MNKKFLASLILVSFTSSPSFALDLYNIRPVNPIENSPNTYQAVFDTNTNVLKRGLLSKNTIKNQYTIAMDKFMQSNVQASYSDFKILIDNVQPNDYYYMKMTQEMASIGFFRLAKLSMSKIQDKELSESFIDDIKLFYFPKYELTRKDEIYLAEIYSNISYNNQSKEATAELEKQTELLTNSDYANYLVAFGNLKNGDIKSAKKSIENAIELNPQNINYKKLKAEIYALSSKPQTGVKYMSDINLNQVSSTHLENELISTQKYIQYKTEKNEYLKKYYLAYYYYTQAEYNKALRVLQTSISTKKSINKDVFCLTAKVYYKMKEYEKSQDYAQKTLDINPTNSEALIILGNVAEKNQDYTTAEKYFRKASSSDKSHEADIRLAQLYNKQGNTKKAKEYLSKVLKISSKSYEAYYNMALLDKDREEVYLKKALSINPDFRDAWVELARIEINRNDYDNASSYLQIAKYIDENDYKYYYYQGLVMKNSGLNDEAKVNFEKSINLNPDFELARKELSI